MASVTLQAGPFTVQIEDEDETAAKVVRLAHKELVAIVAELEIRDDGEQDG